MSILVLNPNTSTYVRVNNDIIYVDFDSNSVMQYMIDEDAYREIDYYQSEGNSAWYDVASRTFSGSICVDFYTHAITIKPECDVRYFEYEEDDVHAVI